MSVIEQKKKNIIDLFQAYRYSFLKEIGNILVFDYTSGMYTGVEIVPVTSEVDKKQIEKIRDDYSKSGYATHIYETSDISVIEKNLFNGFFQTKLSNERIHNKYKLYCERVMLQFGKKAEDYQYIEAPYELEEDFQGKQTSEHLVDSIFSQLQMPGAKLIILEAPAGFGKTSTTYEVLNKYKDVTRDVRPFMMELYKDRTASIFKYILLSNIDADFDVNIKSDIVIKNIRAGRIPLLIDGFDELLSIDIDKAGNKDRFKEVESMLSTIADLLSNDAKIMLTSRKTAIFSSEEFVSWYDKLVTKGLNFRIIKYSLNNPTLQDWISKEEIAKYDNNLLKALGNPVLLGFIKYCGFDLSDSKDIVNKFFDLLLNREMDRQDLPFSVDEQKIIFRRLAMAFAGFNCSTDTRNSVMSTISETSPKLIASKVSASRDRDSLLNSLTNHALLNRKTDKNQIGFLNDFIFGIMLAEAFLHYRKDDTYVLDFASDIKPDSVYKCIDSAVFLPPEDKTRIRYSLKQHIKMGKEDETMCDWKLCGYVNAHVDNLSFDGDRLIGCTIGTRDNIVSNCTFSNMTFSSCTFDFNYIQGCTFVMCDFEDCVREGTNTSCYEYGCADPDGVVKIDGIVGNIEPDVVSDEEIKISILQKYYTVGQRRRMKLISAIRKDFTTNEKQFRRCLDSLSSEKFLFINGDKSFITNEGNQWLQSKECSK